MSPDRDYYRILGVLDDAEDVVVKAAYRAMAQRYHPDKWVGDPAEANRRMAEINDAFAVLSDPANRAAYDAQRYKHEFNVEETTGAEYENESSALNKDNSGHLSNVTGFGWYVAGYSLLMLVGLVAIAEISGGHWALFWAPFFLYGAWAKAV